jgi:hypothetical protein
LASTALPEIGSVACPACGRSDTSPAPVSRRDASRALVRMCRPLWITLVVLALCLSLLARATEPQNLVVKALVCLALAGTALSLCALVLGAFVWPMVGASRLRKQPSWQQHRRRAVLLAFGALGLNLVAVAIGFVMFAAFVSAVFDG